MEEKFIMNAVTFVDSWGKVRLSVGASSDGNPFLAILDDKGNINAIFNITPDEEPYIKRAR